MDSRFKNSPAPRTVQSETRYGETAIHWKLKALGYKFLSAMPGGEALHFWLQRHVTRTLPRQPHTHASLCALAQTYATLLYSRLQKELGACTVLEFGAGRDLGLTLALRKAGIGRVVALDLKPLARIDLVNVAASRILPQPEPIPSLTSLESLGIDYRAPLDMRRSGFPDDSFDGVVSYEVMEHVPKEDIAAILNETRRILRVGGIAIMKIDYSDHYARGTAVSRFNFLKYAESTWDRYNSGFQHLNRLRHSDYVRKFSEACLEVVHSETSLVEPVEEVVQNLAEPFRSYSLDDLFVANALIIARKT